VRINGAWRFSMTFKLALPALLFVLGCRTTDSKPKHFFEQARRREANSEERDLMVHLTGCSSFFVKNSVGKTYLMTAQHCLKGTPPEQWCTEHANHNIPAPESGGLSMSCRRVIAWEEKRDIVLLELETKPELAGRGAALARFAPEGPLRLKMVGYPLDGQSNFRTTVTENCWVLQSPVESPHINTEYQWKDTAARHNCSTYAGNSGGPMLMENTDIVVGLPFTYKPDDFNQYAPFEIDSSAWMALMSEFVEKFYDQLNTAGVIIAQSQPAARDPGEYLPTGKYLTVPTNDCPLYLVPSYLSNTQLKHVYATECFNGSLDDATFRVFQCSDERNCAADDGSKLQGIGKRMVVYRKPDGARAAYYFMGQKVEPVVPNPGFTGNDPQPYFKWDAGQPDDDDHDENCVLAKLTGRWADYVCSQQKLFACRSSSDPAEWRISIERGAWADSADKCPEGFAFSYPSNDVDTENMKEAMRGESVWINLSDEQREGEFVGQ
jgi:hypothetical protein